MSKVSRGLGQVLAPWPFVLFGVIAVAGGATLWPWLGVARGIMVAFDVAAVVFACGVAHLFDDKVTEMRVSADRNDANRGAMLAIAFGVMIVILVTVADELTGKGRASSGKIGLVSTTLVLAWSFSSLMYALHYAHLFYTTGEKGRDCGGLKFPDTDEPNYWDFLYFSTCLAMTFQTSDVNITSRAVRITVMVHCLGAFVFNLGVLAFSINILGSS